MCEEVFQFYGFPSARPEAAMVDIYLFNIAISSEGFLVGKSFSFTQAKIQMRVDKRGAGPHQLRSVRSFNTPDVKTYGFYFVRANFVTTTCVRILEATSEFAFAE